MTGGRVVGSVTRPRPVRTASSAVLFVAAVGILPGLDELPGDEAARVEHRENGEEGRELAADGRHRRERNIPLGGTGRLRAMATHEHHHLQASWAVALSATLHCLTGCAIGEVLGMIIGSALGWTTGATVALSIALAFLFGYSLTSLPLLRSGMALAAVVPIALATDTVSIAIMEIVDNTIMVAIPGAMEAGLTDPGFYAALTAALIIAGAAALPVNRWLIARGKGHAVIHRYH